MSRQAFPLDAVFAHDCLSIRVLSLIRPQKHYVKRPVNPLPLSQLRKKLRSFACPEKHRILTSFFKCGPGEYGEGDCFLGVTVPQTKSLIPFSTGLRLKEIRELLLSPIHEERLLALLILNSRFRKADSKARTDIYRFYLANLSAVNNWDLVDSSAHKIAGAYLENQGHGKLLKMAKSKKLWERRIAVVATWHFIRLGRLEPTFEITRMLLKDREDLMHKACGWMLREAGKKDRAQLEKFLKNHAAEMPRTMLRYAIEKFSAGDRKKYLLVKKTVRKEPDAKRA